MKIVLSTLLIFAFQSVAAQNIVNIDPTIEKIPLYTKTEQIEWDNAIDILTQLENGDLEYETGLTEKQKLSIDLLENGEGPLTQGVSCSWYCGGGPSSITTTAIIYDTITLIDESYNLHDFNRITSWTAPLKKSLGTKINFNFSKDSQRMNSIVIWNGNHKNKELWNSYARVKSIKVYVNNEPKYILNLHDSWNKQIFRLDKLETYDLDKDLSLTFEIIDIYAGKAFEIASISEINFDGKSH